MEFEIRELLLQLQEIVKIEHLVKRTCAIKIIHYTVCAAQGLCHVHDLCAQGRHTGTTAYPHHLGLGVEYRMEVSVRTGHKHLVTGLERENVT